MKSLIGRQLNQTKKCVGWSDDRISHWFQVPNQNLILGFKKCHSAGETSIGLYKEKLKIPSPSTIKRDHPFKTLANFHDF